MSLTPPYTPQQNPVAEIGNCTTTGKARTLLKQASITPEFWAEAVSTAVYLENLTPVASRNWLTPFELWHNMKPSYSHLGVFGCLAYVHIGKERHAGKFLDVAKRGTHLGYQDGKHNHRIWLIDKKRMVYSHDVMFNKKMFPYSSLTSNFPDEDDHHVDTIAYQDSSSSDSIAPVTDGFVEDVPDTDDSSSNFSPASLIVPSPNSPPAPPKPSFSYVPASQPAPQEITSNIDPENILTHRHRANADAACHTNTVYPVSYNQALQRPESHLWVEPIQQGLNALEKMNVLTEVSLPEGEQALGTTWAFKRKTNQDGELIKYKYRLCAQGFSQREGID